MLRRPADDELGQAMVESAIVIPTMLFLFIGLLQLTLAYHGRLVAEYAAFKAARAGSIFRADCAGHMAPAALAAVLPSLNRSNLTDSLQGAAAATWNRFSANQNQRGEPIVLVEYLLTNRRASFDEQLARDVTPTELHVRVFYFFEYRIDIIDRIMARWWLALETGIAAVQSNPLLPFRDDVAPPQVTSALPDVARQIAARNITNGVFTVPVVATWSMRMMSDPLPGTPDHGSCPVAM